jgi:hypothetical protein
MTRNKTYALLLAVALALCGALLASCAPRAEAQSGPPAAPIIKTRFEVQRMTSQSLQVRGLSDVHELHTFTFSPEIRGKMQNVLNAGGYQFGDKVVVWYRRGETVAVKIKGKPSKPK